MLLGTSINEAFNTEETIDTKETFLYDQHITNQPVKKNEPYHGPPYSYPNETIQPFSDLIINPNDDNKPIKETNNFVASDNFDELKKELEKLKAQINLPHPTPTFVEDNKPPQTFVEDNKTNSKPEVKEYNKEEQGIIDYSDKIHAIEKELFELHKYNNKIKNKMEEYKNYYNSTKNNIFKKNNIEHFGLAETIEEKIMSKNFHDILLFIIFGIFVILLIDSLYNIKNKIRV